jgi:hypothetical protein
MHRIRPLPAMESILEHAAYPEYEAPEILDTFSAQDVMGAAEGGLVSNGSHSYTPVIIGN